MKKTKIFFAVSLAMLLVIVFVGCKNSTPASTEPSSATEAPTETEQQTDTAQTEETAEPAEVSLMLLVWELPPENDPIKTAIEEATNTKITLVLPASSDYNQKMMTLVAGGDYPDLMNVRDNVTWQLFADQNVIMPVDDLLQYAPVLTEEIPQNFWDLYLRHGSHWGVPRLNVPSPVHMFARLDWIEELGFGSDWEDTLGKEESKTLDEFYDLLNAMKETYGATYGKGIYFSFIDSLAPFFGAFGTSAYDDFYFIDDDGSFSRARQSDRMYEALVWLNKVYSEGLLDPEMLTDQAEQINYKAANGQMGMLYCIWNVAYRMDKDMGIKDIDPQANWGRINPPIGPHGDSYVTIEWKQMDGVLVISSKAEHPDKVIEILNYLRGDGYELSTYGIEGVDYEWKGEGDAKERIVLTPENTGWIHTWSVMRVFWDPYWWYPDYGDYAEALEDAATETSLLTNIAECFSIEPIYEQYGADLNEYEKEMLTAFITGDKSLDQWEEYKQDCNGIYHADEINDEIYNGLKSEGRVD